ncbi:ATP-binding cassette domain-containing protein [Dietzia aerolata]|uniref:ATP-binding cassette domain-containing protein n=1 Tax=Dietzia aerolata TaxID=595984 RepID=UPI00362CC069
MSTAIEVHDLTRTHRSTTALDSLNVSFEAGVIHGLLGRNGAGKTSLMAIASGQDWPTSGSVTVFGERPHENEQVLPASASSARTRGTSRIPTRGTRSPPRPWPSRTGTRTWPIG